MANTQLIKKNTPVLPERQNKHAAEDLKTLAEEQVQQIGELISQMANSDLAPITTIQQLNNLANELKMAATGFVNSLDSLISKRSLDQDAIPLQEQAYLALLGADKTITPHLRGNDYNTAGNFIQTAHQIRDITASLEHNFTSNEEGYLLAASTKNTAASIVEMISDLGRSSWPDTFYI